MGGRTIGVLVGGVVVVLLLAGCSGGTTTVDAGGQESAGTAGTPTTASTSSTMTSSTTTSSPAPTTAAAPTPTSAGPSGVTSNLVGTWRNQEEAKFCRISGNIIDDDPSESNVCMWGWDQTTSVSFAADGTVAMETRDGGCTATWEVPGGYLAVDDVRCDQDRDIDPVSLEVGLDLDPADTGRPPGTCFVLIASTRITFCTPGSTSTTTR